MTPLRTATAVLLLAAAGKGTSAHDTWLRLAASRAESGSPIRLDLTSGMAFPGLETAIRKERVAQARVRLGGTTTPIERLAVAAKSLRLEIAPAARGVATVWVELHPRELTLTPALVQEYLHEIGASQEIAAHWATRPEPKRWREVYTKHAKTLVRVGGAGDAQGDTSWRDPVGMKLELVPENDPLALRRGGTLVLRLLKDGRPLAGLAVGAERARKRVFQTSDSEGRVTFTLDQAGPWLLAATELREGANGRWESDFSTLTLEVGEAR